MFPSNVTPCWDKETSLCLIATLPGQRGGGGVEGGGGGVEGEGEGPKQ